MLIRCHKIRKIRKGKQEIAWKEQENEQENYNSKREDLEEEDQREDERNVIL